MINHGNNTVNINMFKLVILGDAANPHIQRWLSYFVKKKYNVHLISFREHEIDGVHLHYIKPPNFLIIQNIENSNLNLSSFILKLGYIFCFYRIRKLIYKLSPDILHAHWATSYGLAGALSGYSPYIISTWGIDIVDLPKQPWIMKKIVQFNLSKANAITSTSAMLKKETEKYIKPDQSVFHIPFGIDLKLFSKKVKKSRGKKICIGTVRSLEKKYGITYLIEAFNLIKLKETDTELMIVGTGSLHEKLVKQAEASGVNNNITFTGRVSNNDVVSYLHKIDIFVVPSISESETFGVSAVEASACSLPVIASNIGGLPEVVVNGKTGMLVPPGDVDALVSSILLLIRSPELRLKLGDNGRKYIKSKYAIDSCGLELENIYKKLINSVK